MHAFGGVHFQSNTLSRPMRQPITANHLLAIRTFLRSSSLSRDARMLWAAVTSTFYGLLRSSEFTAPSQTSFIHSTLCIWHLSFASDHSRVTLRLPFSKTDQFGLGADIQLHRLHSKLCPFSALTRFIRHRPPILGPLFIFSNGDFLTRSHIVTLLRTVFPNQLDLNTHSFRIGGASALAAAGLPDFVIQVIGRWSSDSFLRYIRIPVTDLRPYQAVMASLRHR